MDTAKAVLQRYLQTLRDVMLWKLDGLTEEQQRRPISPTGTNLLGLVKHLAATELDYFGEVFDRPVAVDMPWLAQDAPDNADMYATAQESPVSVTQLYRRAWAHADATIADLPLQATGQVPWWAEEHRQVTLHQIIVHVIVDTARHAGHADILRESLDGSAGLTARNSNLPEQDEATGTAYLAMLQDLADGARDHGR